MRALVFFVVILVGCARDPAMALCPELAAGELVVTEFRGPQSPDDTVWVEIYNASGRSLDLEGLKIRFRKKDGSSEIDVLVRRPLQASAGAYVVLGLVQDDSSRPAYIDYGFAGDFMQGFLPAAAVDVVSCDHLIDRAVYDVLPKMGTHSLGTRPPDANANDIPASWCDNPAPAGTPQQPNPPCP